MEPQATLGESCFKFRFQRNGEAHNGQALVDTHARGSPSAPSTPLGGPPGVCGGPEEPGGRHLPPPSLCQPDFWMDFFMISHVISSSSSLQPGHSGTCPKIPDY